MIKHSLVEESLWAVNKVKDLRVKEDSAIIFVSWNALDLHLNILTSCWNHPNCNHAIAIKTQPHIEILRHIVSKGFGLEAASWEEVQLARIAGCPAERIVFDSPVKRPHEIEDCAKNSPGMLINANSIQELDRLAPYSASIRIGLRINTMVDTDAPEAYHVSGDQSKFGVPISDRMAIKEALLNFPIEALHVHAASSVQNVEGLVRGLVRIRDLADDANTMLENQGVDRRIHLIDVGGGLMPETLEDGIALKMKSYVSRLHTEIPDLWTNFSLVTEFGQWVHFHCGYAVSDIEYVMERGESQIAYLHLGADFLLRDVYLDPRGITWIPMRSGQILLEGEVPTDLAGPICFAGDYLDRKVLLPKLSEGDEMLFLNTGSNAYGLWSRHTSRSIPAVYGVDFSLGSIELLSPRCNPFI